MITKNSRIFSTILIIVFFLITIFTVYSLSAETHQALKGAVQDKLMAVASATASQIDGDSFAMLRPGNESSGDYIHIRDQIRSVKLATNGIHYIYTLQKTGNAVEFVVDGDYGYDSDAAVIGQEYPEAEPELFSGFTGPSADNTFTTDKWGTVLSGFAPIHDHAGNIVGIVGVDMDGSAVNAELNFLNVILYGIGILAMISVIVGILVIERRRAIDEQKIAESEKKYRLLFERAADAIFLLEAEGKNQGAIVSANQAAAEMHGYTIKEMQKLNITDLDSAQGKQLAPERIEQILRGVWLHGEILHRKKDGTEFPVEFSSGLLDLDTKKYILAIDHDISEQKKAGDALQQVTKKLSLLNSVTFNDIQNAVFTLNGYLTLGKTHSENERMTQSLNKAEESARKISRSLNFAKNYQDLGVKPPRWQNVNQVFLLAISHLDFSHIDRSVNLDMMEIYADPLLERVFFTLADNILHHAKTATSVTIGYQMAGDDLVLFFEDNGQGIPDAIKDKIFDRGFGSQNDMDLFLVREILSITGLSIRENGIPGKTGRFEITVPNGMYRFTGKS